MPINNVRDAMHEMKKGSKHIKTKKQAIAVGLKAQREKGKGGKKGFVPFKKKGAHAQAAALD